MWFFFRIFAAEFSLCKIMKKYIMIITMLWITLAAMSIPAKRGVWKILTLKDGSEVKAWLVGDEYCHYWRTADGTAYLKRGDHYVTADAEVLKEKRQQRMQAANSRRVQRLNRAIGEFHQYSGTKRGLIILANFADTEFKAEHNKEFFERMANEENYQVEPFKGSIYDYFKDQSRGKFELTFDVVGPVTLSHEYKYYGGNDEEGSDSLPGTMVAEAVKAATELVKDWSVYDWDKDSNNEIDQVYILYSGYGEADSKKEDTIWPHEWKLTSANYYEKISDVTYKGLKVTDKYYVNTYACGNELNYKDEVDGIGTICHEFSHCLGYPDTYDTNYIAQGMFVWDLMDTGNYNGGGHRPAGFTSYERWMAGWLQPKVLADKDTTITDMKSLQNDGESYIIYNPGNDNEYFLLENRQLDGWDASLPGSGLLIMHVDYKNSVWKENKVNSEVDHQRMTWMPADNEYQYNEREDGGRDCTWSGAINDLYPNSNNTQFNKDSAPAATLFNENTDGTKFLHCSIEQITQNADGTIGFKYVANYQSTAIRLLQRDGSKESAMYNLQGQRVKNPTKGLYIVDNKKVFIGR